MAAQSPGEKSAWPRWKWAAALSLVITLAGCGIVFAANLEDPVGTARHFARAADYWREHWPLPRGNEILWRVQNLCYAVGLLRPVTVQVRPGVVMELDPRDLVTKTILLDGIWEPEITGIVDSLPRDGVFIDVGAHVGYYSLLASARVGAKGRVVSVEPNPPTIERLRRNVHLSQAVNITVEEVACTDRETLLPFFKAGTQNTGSSSLAGKTAGSTNEITVQGLPLDAIVRALGLQRIDLVKMDVEGAELQVLRGMKESLAKYHPQLVVEIRPDLLANLGTSVAEVHSFLNDNGYAQGRQIDAVDSLWTPTPGARNRQLAAPPTLGSF